MVNLRSLNRGQNLRLEGKSKEILSYLSPPGYHLGCHPSFDPICILQVKNVSDYLGGWNSFLHVWSTDHE